MLQKESTDILAKILMANTCFAIASIIAFFFISDFKEQTKLHLVSLPIIVCLSFMLLLLIIQFKIKSVRQRTLYTIGLSYGLYWASMVFYFYLDTIPMIILTGLLYLFVTQILMTFKYTLLFGMTGIAFSIYLVYFRFGNDLDIGYGFGITMIYLFVIGVFSVRRYIQLFRAYQLELESQVNALTDIEIRNEMLHQASKEVIWDLDLSKQVRQFSTDALSQYGDRLSASSKLEDWMHDIHPEDAQAFYRGYRTVLEGEANQFEMEFRQLSQSGKTPWYFTRVISKKDDEGKVIKVAGSYTEITDRKLKDMQMNYLAYNDILTGLPNRSAYFRDFEQWQNEKADTCVYLIFMDIINFREFNSTFGHYSGDILIQEIAQRLRRLKLDLTIYQLTAIDFGMIGFGCEKKFTSITDQILAQFKEPFYVGE